MIFPPSNLSNPPYYSRPPPGYPCYSPAPVPYPGAPALPTSPPTYPNPTTVISGPGHSNLATLGTGSGYPNFTTVVSGPGYQNPTTEYRNPAAMGSDLGHPHQYSFPGYQNPTTLASNVDPGLQDRARLGSGRVCPNARYCDELDCKVCEESIFGPSYEFDSNPSYQCYAPSNHRLPLSTAYPYGPFAANPYVDPYSVDSAIPPPAQQQYEAQRGSTNPFYSCTQTTAAAAAPAATSISQPADRHAAVQTSVATRPFVYWPPASAYAAAAAVATVVQPADQYAVAPHTNAATRPFEHYPSASAYAAATTVVQPNNYGSSEANEPARPLMHPKRHPSYLGYSHCLRTTPFPPPPVHQTGLPLSHSAPSSDPSSSSQFPIYTNNNDSHVLSMHKARMNSLRNNDRLTLAQDTRNGLSETLAPTSGLITIEEANPPSDDNRTAAVTVGSVPERDRVAAAAAAPATPRAGGLRGPFHDEEDREYFLTSNGRMAVVMPMEHTARGLATTAPTKGRMGLQQRAAAAADAAVERATAAATSRMQPMGDSSFSSTELRMRELEDQMEELTKKCERMQILMMINRN